MYINIYKLNIKNKIVVLFVTVFVVVGFGICESTTTYDRSIDRIDETLNSQEKKKKKIFFSLYSPANFRHGFLHVGEQTKTNDKQNICWDLNPKWLFIISYGIFFTFGNAKERKFFLSVFPPAKISFSNFSSPFPLFKLTPSPGQKVTLT